MGTPDLEDPSPAESSPAAGREAVRHAVAESHADQRRTGGVRMDRRMLLPLILILVIAGGFAVLLQGTSHNAQPLPGGVRSAKSTRFLGNELEPPKAAPTLSLRNYLGGPRVNLASYRGKAVLVTFLYTHCPDVCPLITANLRIALSLMSATTAAKTQIIAVSVDPRGDTARTVADFLKVHQMTGRMLYLTGSTKELGHVWQAWGVGSERDAEQPDFINHSALVYGVDGSGRLRTIYISDSWKPKELVHDVLLLAAQ